MSKRVWNRPEAVVEEFVANEYVAACWEIKCLVPVTDPDGNGRNTDGFGQDPYGHQMTSGTCGGGKNMYIREEGNNLYSMVEDRAGVGILPCTVYDYIDYKDSKVTGSGVSKFSLPAADSSGNITLYWTTEIPRYNAKYYHYGTVNLTDNSKTTQHS